MHANDSIDSRGGSDKRTTASARKILHLIALEVAG
jgi:hypothetical protein